METLLVCCFCTETLSKPWTLPCFHSFCHHCLERFVATRREDAVKAGTKIPEIFECPICRTEFHLAENGSVKKIHSNHFINNMLELLSLQEQAVKCQSCKAKHTATSRCISCENYLCEKCLEAHNNWPAFEDHVVLTIEELAKPENRAKAREKPRCEKHDEVMKLYCETCKVLVCRQCADVHHARLGHSWFPLADVVAQHKEVLRISSGIFEKELKETVRSNQNVEHVMETLKNNAAKAKDAIRQQHQEILIAFTKKLEGQTSDLLHQVDMKYNEANMPLLRRQADVKDYLEKTRSSLCFAKNIISSGTDEEILSLRREVEEKAKGIEKERPQLTDPLHNGAFEYQGKSSKNVLENVKLNDMGKIVSPALKRKRRQLVYPAMRSLLKSSTILNGNIVHAKQLVEWVEDRTFGWKLCYRASVDGWEGQNFHRKCDDVGSTVTLVKCENNVFGGYSDNSWKQTSDSIFEYKSSSHSFLFSLRSKDNLGPFKCPIYDLRQDKAVWCYSLCGAIFGGGPDLHISSNANTNLLSFTNLGNTYRPPDGYEPDTPQTRALLAGSYKFTPTEVEVFRR